MIELLHSCISTCVGRNLLKVGVHEVWMWPTARFSEKEISGEKFFCAPNPLGPIADNGDPTAVKLTIEFEHFAHPVVFPNDVPTGVHVVKKRYADND